MCSQYNKLKHDIGLVNTDGTITGLMLARKNGIPQYSVFSDQYLANQFFTSEPGYASLPAEKELAIRQSGWRSGLGLDVYDRLDAERYLKTLNMDMRFKGMGIASTKATSITMPTPAVTSPLFANMEFESTGTWSAGARNSADAPKKGTYYWRLAAGTLTSSQDSSAWDNAWRGKTFTFGCWGKNSVYDSGAWIRIDDGVGTSDSSTITATSWTLATVTRTLNAAATQLRIVIGQTGAANVADFDWGYVTSSNAPVIGACTAMCEFNDLLYLAMGCSLYKLNGTGDGFTIVQTFHTKITALEVFGSNLYIALGTSETYWQMSTAEAFTRNDLAVNYAQFMRTVHAATPVFWINDGVNTLRSSTNPAAGGSAFSGQTTVGSDADPITGLSSEAGLLYVPKEDMPYYLNSSGAVQNDLAPELATLARSTDNGKRAAWWLHKFYMPWGQSLLEEDGGTLTWRSPSDFSTKLSDFVGQVFAIAGDDRYLYAVVDNSTKVEVLAGRLEVIDGTTKWVWHSLNEITLTGCESAWVSSIYQKRLWISSTSSSESLYYIPLPLSYGNILSDTNRDFVSGGEFETPWLHGEFRDTQKAFPDLTISMGHNYDTDIYFATHYKTLSNSTYTKIADMKGSATSMVQTNSLPDAGTNHPVDTAIRLKFVANTDLSNTSPVLLSYNLKGFLVPTPRKIIALQVRCAQDLTLNDATHEQSYIPVKAAMDEFIKSTWPVQFTDIAGTVTNVRPLPPPVAWWQTTALEKGREMERVYNLLLQEVTL